MEENKTTADLFKEKQTEFEKYNDARNWALEQEGTEEVEGVNSWWVGPWIKFKDGSVASIGPGFGLPHVDITVENSKNITGPVNKNAINLGFF